jgi:hypothetical protein
MSEVETDQYEEWAQAVFEKVRDRWDEGEIRFPAYSEQDEDGEQIEMIETLCVDPNGDITHLLWDDVGYRVIERGHGVYDLADMAEEIVERLNCQLPTEISFSRGSASIEIELEEEEEDS